MKLYHFTAKHLIDKIKIEGLTLGGIPLILPKGLKMIKPAQWLTSNPEFNQSWCSEKVILKYNRNDYRITVKIPKGNKNIYSWLDLCKIPELKETSKYLNASGDSENWFIYFGNIKPKWFREIISR